MAAVEASDRGDRLQMGSEARSQSIIHMVEAVATRRAGEGDSRKMRAHDETAVVDGREATPIRWLEAICRRRHWRYRAVCRRWRSIGGVSE